MGKSVTLGTLKSEAVEPLTQVYSRAFPMHDLQVTEPNPKREQRAKGDKWGGGFWGGRGKVRDVPGEESVPLWRVFHHYITYHYFSVAFLYTVIFLLKPYLFLQSVCSPGCSSKDHEPHLSLGVLELQCLVVPGDNQTCIVFVFLLSTI